MNRQEIFSFIDNRLLPELRKYGVLTKDDLKVLFVDHKELEEVLKFLIKAPGHRALHEGIVVGVLAETARLKRKTTVLVHSSLLLDLICNSKAPEIVVRHTIENSPIQPNIGSKINIKLSRRAVSFIRNYFCK